MTERQRPSRAKTHRLLRGDHSVEARALLEKRFSDDTMARANAKRTMEDPVETLDSVLRNSAPTLDTFSMTDADRLKLEAIQCAGEGNKWSFTIQVGTVETVKLARINPDGSLEPWILRKDEVVATDNLTITPDGIIVMWDTPPDGELPTKILAPITGLGKDVARDITIVPTTPEAPSFELLSLEGLTQATRNGFAGPATT